MKKTSERNMDKTSRTDWFHEAKWGLFTHFIAHEKWDLATMTPEKWNAVVDGHDSAKLAKQLHEIGAGYFFLTISQTDGYFCSPNKVYDRIMGVTSPEKSKCSRRDLVSDLADALAKYGIRLMVYLASEAPVRDPDYEAVFAFDYNPEHHPWLPWWTDKKAVERFAALKKDSRLASFQRKWEDVIAEWSKNWGSKVNGWWIDGCSRFKEMYDHPEAPNYKSFAAAMRAGNPASLVSFNVGDDFLPSCPEEDYLAGELGFPVTPGLIGCQGRFIGHAQFHVLPCPHWALLKYGPDELYNVMESVVSKGGCITFDTPFNEDGSISDEAFALFKEVGPRIAKLKRREARPVPKAVLKVKRHPGFDVSGASRDGVLSVKLVNTCGHAISGSVHAEFPQEPPSLANALAEARKASASGAFPVGEIPCEVKHLDRAFSLESQAELVLPLSVSRPLRLAKSEIPYSLKFGESCEVEVPIENSQVGGRGSLLEFDAGGSQQELFVPLRKSFKLERLARSASPSSLKEALKDVPGFAFRLFGSESLGLMKFGLSGDSLAVFAEARDERVECDRVAPFNASCVELFIASPDVAFCGQKDIAQLFLTPEKGFEIMMMNKSSRKCEALNGATGFFAPLAGGYEIAALVPLRSLAELGGGIPGSLHVDAVLNARSGGRHVKQTLFDSPFAFASSAFFSELVLG